MLHTRRSFHGMVVAPHHLAADAGRRALQDGGNAIEAMIAAASTIAVVYPHMNGLGGDNFWLVHTPGQVPIGIDACGAAAEKATREFYSKQGFNQIPHRGPLAALTVTGALSGWQAAYDYSLQNWDGTLPLERLLEDATHYARSGMAVTKTLAGNAANKLDQLRVQPGFSGVYLNDGVAPVVGDRFTQPAMAETLHVLAREGLDSFYRGELAKSIAGDLRAVGSPIAASDLSRHRALHVAPLALEVSGHQLFNMPPPTQGLTSLMLLGVFDRLQVKETETFEFVHGLVEATKQSFRVRDLFVTDPDYMEKSATTFLKSDLKYRKYKSYLMEKDRE